MKGLDMKKKILVLSLLMGIGSTLAFAQSRHYNSFTLGMGGGGTAFADGYHANFINPANLMLDNHHSNNTLGLLGGLGVKNGGSLLNVSVYNKYLTKGLVIEGQVREDMLNEWFGSSSANVREQAAEVSVVPFGFSHRGNKSAFSLASRVRVTEEFSMNKGMMEVMAYGLDSEKFSTPTPMNFGMNSVAFAEVSVGYARQILSIPNLLIAKDVKLYVGIAPKYLYGIYTGSFGFQSTFQINSATANTPLSINHTFSYDLQTIGEISRQMQEYATAYDQDSDTELGDYVEFTGDDLGSPQATGFGLDMGGTLEMDISALPIPLFMNKKKTLRVSMSVTDLGKLNFNQDASSIYAEGEFDYKGLQNDGDFDTYFNDLGDSLTTDVYGDFQSKQSEGIVYELPSMYNFGASLEMGKLLLALDYGVGFNSSGVNSTRSVINLGAQYRLLGFIPIRVGTRMGGYSSASYSAGIGLDFNFLEFTISGSMVNNSAKHGSSATVAWSGLVLRF